MTTEPSTPPELQPQPQPQKQAIDYQQTHSLVEAEFVIEEGFMEHDVPTFIVTLKPNSKEAFLRLYQKLDSLGLAPFFRKRDSKNQLKVVPKPAAKPSNNLVNIALFLATVATLSITGYLLSSGSIQQDPVLGAVMFTAAMLGILGAHEMAHKLTADRHLVKATYPYFIPGIPPLGTFGAVIQQKSMAPNKDALFDLGMSGPVMGFIVTVFVTVIGVQLSQLVFTAPEGSSFIQVPLLFEFIVAFFPPSGQGSILMLHPVAYAGYIGMIVTMLNLLPAGMLDGGHVAEVWLKDRARTILSLVAVAALVLIGAWLMAILVFFMLRYPHPGALDEVSKLSNSRKLATLALIAIFALTIAPLITL